MLLNAFIILFIIGLAYWQGIQGFFSAVLHLVLVIVAGALAFAFWEPISMGMLSGMMPRYAWAIGLVMPFVFILLILRVAMDRLVPANVDFSQLTNMIGGVVCGAVAGVLTTGIFVIGISYLPGAADNFGYKPYVIDPKSGEVVAYKGLVLGVDSITESFFDTLSSGSFAPANGKSLATHQPQIVRRAALYRLRKDPNTTTAATPGAITIVSHLSHLAPSHKLPPAFIENLRPQEGLNLPSLIKDEKYRLVTVETQWNKDGSAAFDSDRLRVYPNQAHLVVTDKSTGKPRLFAPIAVAKQTDSARNEREFAVVNRDEILIASAGEQTIKLTFVFLISKELSEQFLIVRNLRLPLEDKSAKESEPDEIAAVVGTTVAKVSTTEVATNTNTGTNTGTDTKDGGTTPNVGPRTGGKGGIVATDVEISPKTPKVSSKNLASTLQFNGKNEIIRGTGKVNQPTGFLSKALTFEQFYVPEDQLMVRVKLSREKAASLLGHAMLKAGEVHPIFLEDHQGNKWRPNGYVWLQTASGVQNFRYDPDVPIPAVTELPSEQQMAPTDELYLYFVVKKGVRLMAFKVGVVSSQELPQIEVK